MYRALALLLALGGAACTPSVRGEDGRVARPARVSVFALEVGDCFQRPDDPSAVTAVRVVPCDRPHDSEVFAVAEHPGADAAPYPGADALQAFAEEACLGQAFVDYVGVPYAESALIVYPITPTDDSWGTGDRAVSCVLSGDTLSASARGSRG